MALPTLILPDVHENIPQVERILKRYLPRVSRVITLGDSFDSWTRSERTTLRTAHWLRDVLHDPRFTVLLGNHDIPYLWPIRPFTYWGGYSLTSHALIQGALSPEDLASLRDLPARLCTMAHGWLLSHAGFHPHHIPLIGWSEAWARKEAARAARLAGLGNHYWVWASGYDRGGREAIGGPLWIDWGSLPDQPKVLPPQIVGHTPTRAVRRNGRNVCLDTALRDVGLLYEDGHLEVEPMPTVA